MHALDVLADPNRRRILELLAEHERSAGDLVQALSDEVGLSQPAVSQHLLVLRERGFAAVRVDGKRRMYSIDPGGLRDVDAWLNQFRHFWEERLDALGDEIARGPSDP